MDIIAQLKAERDKKAQQLNALDTAIGALSGLNSTRATRGRRTMSAAGRARIAAAQRARWAKVKGQRKVVAIAPKRKISAAGLARIRAANKARWAKWRGGGNSIWEPPIGSQDSDSPRSSPPNRNLASSILVAPQAKIMPLTSFNA